MNIKEVHSAITKNRRYIQGGEKLEIDTHVKASNEYAKFILGTIYKNNLWNRIFHKKVFVKRQTL